MWSFKGQLFWEGHKNVRNRPYGFEIYLVNIKTMRTIAQIVVIFSKKLNFKGEVILKVAKGQLILKANEFVFTTMRRVSFLEEIEDTKKTFWNYLTFRSIELMVLKKISTLMEYILNNAPKPSPLQKLF